MWPWIIISRLLQYRAPKGQENLGLYFILFWIPKSSRDNKAVLDLKFLKKPRFRMETMKSILAAIPKGDFLFVDGSKRCLSAHLHMSCTQEVLEIPLQWIALPIYFFTLWSCNCPKVLVTIIDFLRLEGDSWTIFWSVPPPWKEYKRQLTSQPKLYNSMGLLSPTLSQMVPTQSMLHLGVIIDTRLHKVFLSTRCARW